MAEETEKRRAGFSVVTFLGAVGGLCLIAAFLTPLFVLDPSKVKSPEAAAMLRDYQAQLDRVVEEIEAAKRGGPAVPPEVQAVAHAVGPATDHVLAFADDPTLYHLAIVARDAHELLPVAAAFDRAHERDIKVARLGVAAFIAFIWAIPLIGLYPVLRGVIRGFRKQSTPGLVLTFFSGLVYLLIGGILLVGVPDDARTQLGPSLWLLAAGGALAVFNGLFGVSRTTWWKAYLIYIFVFGAVFYTATTVAETLR